MCAWRSWRELSCCEGGGGEKSPPTLHPCGLLGGKGKMQSDSCCFVLIVVLLSLFNNVFDRGLDMDETSKTQNFFHGLSLPLA